MSAEAKSLWELQGYLRIAAFVMMLSPGIEHIASPVCAPLASFICPLSAFALNLCFRTRLSLVMEKSRGEGLSFYRMQHKFYTYTLKTEN